MVPHLVFSMRHAGSLLGVLDESRRSTRLDYIGQGLVTYLTTNPFAYYGLLAGPLMVVGVGVGIVHRSRGARLIALVAAVTFLMLGLFSHAQPRYAFLVVNLLVVLGVAGVVGVARRLPRLPQRILVIVGAVLVASCAAGSVADVIRSGPSRNRGANVILRLAEIVRRDAAGRLCEIDSERTPQLSYYSGCDPESSVLDPSRCHRHYLVPLPERPIWPLPPGSPATTAVPDGDGILVIPCPAGAP
jgi:YD repeat-containing protein